MAIKCWKPPTVTMHLTLVAARGSEIRPVISDMVMPGMGGTELASRLRSSFPRIPVLLMTGYTEEAIARNGDRPHDALIIEKPFSQHMLEKVRGALASTQG
jgi:CheY-like chemotaxis protein